MKKHVLALLAFVSLSVSSITQAYAITNCFDYVIWRVTGKYSTNGKTLHRTEHPDFINILKKEGYYKVKTSGTYLRLNKGDVIILAKAHTGYMINIHKIDHFIQVPPQKLADKHVDYRYGPKTLPNYPKNHCGPLDVHPDPKIEAIRTHHCNLLNDLIKKLKKAGKIELKGGLSKNDTLKQMIAKRFGTGQLTVNVWRKNHPPEIRNVTIAPPWFAKGQPYNVRFQVNDPDKDSFDVSVRFPYGKISKFLDNVNTLDAITSSVGTGKKGEVIITAKDKYGAKTVYKEKVPVAHPISIVVTATPDQVDPCGKVVFEAKYGVYEFEGGAKKTMPLGRKDIQRIAWSWEGPHTVLETKKLIWEDQPEKRLVGTVSAVRADWPDSKVKGIARMGNVTGDAVANVTAIAETSPLFKIEDVSTDSKVEVGESFQNHAVEFYCAGINEPDYKPNTDVWWESDSPGILECPSSGRCVGRSPGIANVRLFSREKGRKGAFITSRPVEVYKEQKDCKPLRDAYTEKFNNMIEHYKKRSCDIAKNATGCKQNVAGYLGAYVQDVFVDRYCHQQDYVNCGKWLVDEYYECLKKCNEQWQREIKTQGELRGCQGNCNEKAGKRKKVCKGKIQEDEGFRTLGEGEIKVKEEDEEGFSTVAEDETATVPNFQGIWCANNKRWRIEVKQTGHTAEVTLIDRSHKSYQGRCKEAKIVRKHSFKRNKKKLPPLLTGELNWESYNQREHTERPLPWFFLFWQVPLKKRVDIEGLHSPGIYTDDARLKTQDLTSGVRNTWRGFRGVREGTQGITCPK